MYLLNDEQLFIKQVAKRITMSANIKCSGRRVGEMHFPTELIMMLGTTELTISFTLTIIMITNENGTGWEGSGTMKCNLQNVYQRGTGSNGCNCK